MRTPISIVGREPAVFWAMVATLVQAILLLFPWSDETHGIVNAAVLAAAGLVTAAYVSVDAVLPALTGFIKALFAVLLAFGLQLPDTTQVAVLAIVSAAMAFLVRASVTPVVLAERPAVANSAPRMVD